MVLLSKKKYLRDKDPLVYYLVKEINWLMLEPCSIRYFSACYACTPRSSRYLLSFSRAYKRQSNNKVIYFNTYEFDSILFDYKSTFNLRYLLIRFATKHRPSLNESNI